MQKRLSIAILLACFVLCSLISTGVSLLLNLQSPGDVNLDKIMQGHLLHVLGTGTFWSLYPSLPPLQSMVHSVACFLTVPLLAGAYYLLRHRRRCEFSTVALVSLLVGAVPYAVGRLALCQGLEPESVGPWVATMLLGLLYAGLTGAMFAGLGLIPSNRMELRRPQRAAA